MDSITDSMNMSERAPGDGDGQGSLVYCNPCGPKELDMTEQLSDQAHVQMKNKMATHCSILAQESQGQRSLVGYSPQSCKESHVT